MEVLVGACIEMVSQENEHDHNDFRSMQECFHEKTSIYFEVNEDNLKMI